MLVGTLAAGRDIKRTRIRLEVAGVVDSQAAQAAQDSPGRPAEAAEAQGNNHPDQAVALSATRTRFSNIAVKTIKKVPGGG